MSKPFRILHVGGFSVRPKGAFVHGVANKLSNGLIRLGHNVFNFSDRDVARWQTILGNRVLGRARASRTLLAFAREYRPEILLLGHANMILPDVVGEIRQALPHCRVGQWNVDALFDAGNVRRMSRFARHADATFVSTAGPWDEWFGPSMPPLHFIPNPVDRSIERARSFAAAGHLHDLSVAVGKGSDLRSYGGVERPVDALLAILRRRMPALRIGAAGADGQPVLTGADYQDFLEASRAQLNLSRRNDVRLYSSDRIAHIMGNGLLAFIDRGTGYQELLGEDAAAFFSTEDELVERVAAFAANDVDWRVVAERGWAAYGRLADAETVARYMIDVLLGDDAQHDAPWLRR